jgi:hypothetical protein
MATSDVEDSAAPRMTEHHLQIATEMSSSHRSDSANDVAWREIAALVVGIVAGRYRVGLSTFEKRSRAKENAS